MDNENDARARELRAERERAAAEGRAYAVPAGCDLAWSFGAPLPTILQWEHEAHLFFHLRDHSWIGSAAFDECRAATFGPPGEDGHALSGSGWESYTALEVVNSAWLARTVGPATGLSHFVFPFHDTTFECIARSFTTNRIEGSLADAVQAAVRLW